LKGLASAGRVIRLAPQAGGEVMFRETLLDSSPTQGAHLTSYQRGISCLAGLVGFAAGAIAFPSLPGFTGPWGWLEGGLASGFIALLYVLMVYFVVADARQAGIRAGPWLAVVLVFIGGQMIGQRWLHIPVTVSLGVVGGVLLIALLASILIPPKNKN